MSSDRNEQTATEAFLEAVSEHAAEVPIIIIATKMDRFWPMQYGEARDIYKSKINDLGDLDRHSKEHAATQVKKRIDLIKTLNVAFFKRLLI